MLINSDGMPALLLGVVNDDGEAAIWHHCFGDGPILDSKKGRAIVTAMLMAHNIAAEYAVPLKKRGR